MTNVGMTDKNKQIIDVKKIDNRFTLAKLKSDWHEQSWDKQSRHGQNGQLTNRSVIVWLISSNFEWETQYVPKTWRCTWELKS